MNKKIKGRILAVCQSREKGTVKRDGFRIINRKLWPGK